MPALLAALEGLPPAYLVGGAVRDLLRGPTPWTSTWRSRAMPREVARAVAGRLGGEASSTSASAPPPCPRPSCASTSRPRAASATRSPGALPEVEPAPLAEDLAPPRLHGQRDGRRAVRARSSARCTTRTAAGRPRRRRGPRAARRAASSTTPRGSCARCATRRAWAGGSTRDTEELARAAIAAGALGTVSGKRDPRRAARPAARAGGAGGARADALARSSTAALYPALRVRRRTARPRRCSAAAETGADPALAALAALIAPDADAMHPWLDRLALTRGERDRVARAAAVAAAARAPARRATCRPRASTSCCTASRSRRSRSRWRWGAPGEPVLRYLSDLAARGSR